MSRVAIISPAIFGLSLCLLAGLALFVVIADSGGWLIYIWLLTMGVFCLSLVVFNTFLSNRRDT